MTVISEKGRYEKNSLIVNVENIYNLCPIILRF